MALITLLEEREKSSGSEHEKVTRATYFFPKEGLLQIDTYGSDGRASESKPSQCIQFSPDAMRQLLDIWGRHVVEVLKEREGKIE